MSSERRAAFARYASWVRSKPTWDAEERVPRLAVAARLRESVAAAAAQADWRTPLLECLRAPGYRRSDLTLRGQDEWFCGWSDTGDPALDAAIAGYASTTTTPGERFAAFADAAAAATAAGLVRDDPPAVMAFGSLLNFAVDPARLPFVLRRPFSELERLLSEEAAENGSRADEYGHHLRFAAKVADTLGSAGVSGNMLDVQAIVFSAARNPGFWSTGPGLARDQSPPRREPPHYLAVCAIYRDEGSYMREWIEFHRLVGVERFFLYDNRSSDDHREVLAPYVERGEVVVHDWPMEQGQLPAYEDCIARHAAEARWIAFIDLDEFLFSPTGRPLPEVLRRYEQWPAVGVNWAVFGNSGHVSRPAGPVIESYVNRLRTGEHRTIKSIVDPTRVARCAGVHAFVYTELGAVDENRFPITGGQTKSESRSLLQVNHYMTKSLEEYRARSARNRPNPYGPQNPLVFRRPFNPELLAMREELAERDEAILQYVPALRAALDLSPA